MQPPEPSSIKFLDEGGACGELIRNYPWERSSLGPIAGWPASLRATVANMLHTRQPMLLFWGPSLIQFYNDAFVPSFGFGKHPAAMGQMARECWEDAWPVVGAQIEAVMARGEPAWYENALVPIHRNGRMEEVFWTYSYSPAYDDSGQIYGTLVIVTSMTARVLLARRLDVLSRLGSSLSTADSHDAVLDVLGRIPVSCPEDVPFLVIYEHDLADPVRCYGIDRQALKRLAGPRSPSGKSEMVEFAGDVRGSVWPEPIRMGFATAVGARPYHLLFGLSPRLPVDHGYRSYLAQIGEQAASALDRIDNASISIATERQRNNLLQQAPVATALMTGPTHVFQLANPLYCRLVGRNPVGKSYFEAFPERRDTELPGILDRVYRTGEPYAVSEMPLPLVRSSSGALEDCFINFNLEALRDQDGVVFGMMAVAIDVTEQVRARQVLEKSDAERQIVMARLEETSRSKDEFLAMLGHELRNPLAPILTALELMAHKDQEKTSARERAVIERQVRHMVRLVDDLLDISRITSRAVTLDKRMVDLAEIITAAVELTAHLVKQRGQHLVMSLPSGVRTSADESRLVQIVANLLTNAAKYTPNGGEIRVTLARDHDQAVLEVADTGVGITAELLPRVFDLFVQSAQRIDRAEGGLGIGLAIVKNLVTLHGGSVVAQSEGSGKGSVFTIRLPIVEDAAHVVVESSPLVTSHVAAKHVLLVDDNEDAVELIGELLRVRGHDVVVAHDPTEALRAVETFRPDFALLDIGLPVMDGYELAARLHAMFPDCTLIALTGYGHASNSQRAIDAGFNAHLVKPAKVAQLLDLIARS